MSSNDKFRDELEAENAQLRRAKDGDDAAMTQMLVEVKKSQVSNLRLRSVLELIERKTRHHCVTLGSPLMEINQLAKGALNEKC